MRNRWKWVGIGALVMVLALAAVGAMAFAQGPDGGSNQPFDFQERFRQTLAGLLGISVEEYDSLVSQAQEKVLNDAVAEGWLTQDQADRMRERMDQVPGMAPWGMGRGFGGHGRGMMGGWGMDLLSVAADKLGLSQSELRALLADGKSIADVAQEKGVDPQVIVDAYLAELTANLNQAVTDGRITQKQADWMLEQAKAQVTEQMNNAWVGPRGFREDMVNLLAVAADQLGMAQADLMAALRDGQTIAGLAREKGLDPQAIVDAYIAELAAKLDQAVAGGTLTRAQADRRLEQARIQATEQLDAPWETFRPGRFGRGHGGGGGPLPPNCPGGETGTDS